MKYFFLDTLGNNQDPTLCRLNKAPDWLSIRWYRPAKGKPAREFWDENPRIDMQEDSPGIKLASLIGNTNCYLIVHTDVQLVIEEHCPDIEIEYLPLVIYNHRKRKHSDEYVIVNPIGTYAALDREASEIKYSKHKPDKIIRIGRFVLKPSKLEGAPALFRLPEDPAEYIMNEPLVNALSDGRFTNFIFREISQSNHD